MQRKIDIGEDKNVFIPDPKAEAHKPTMSFLLDDLAKTPEEALGDARKLAWPNWINSVPLLIGHTDDAGKSHLFFIDDSVKSRVVLIDVWDYTLLQCKRSLAYVKEWQKRYQNAGFMVIGIHAPLFEFGKEKKNVIDATKDYGISYPVMLDNNFAVWKSLENRYWPRRLLIDSNGKINMDVVGEGNYAQFEKSIQILLRNLSPGLACPPVLKPLYKCDEDGYEPPKVTPEIFFGKRWNPTLGNVQSAELDKEVFYTDDSGGSYAEGLPYFEGPWIMSQEGVYGSPLHKKELRLTVKCEGSSVYLVARAKAKNAVDIPQMTKIQFLINNKTVPEDCLGRDVFINEYRKSIAQIRDPKLYHIARNLDDKPNLLTIVIDNSGSDTLEIFGLFFESGA